MKALLSLFLHPGKLGARLRRVSALALLVTYWLGLTLIADAPELATRTAFDRLPFPAPLLGRVVLAAFSPPVLARLLPLLVGLWLGLRLSAGAAAAALDLGSYHLGVRFLRRCLWGMSYPHFELTQGDIDGIPEGDLLRRIGGPGNTRVGPGLAALFEAQQGPPRVAMDGSQLTLDAHERLRALLPLSGSRIRLDRVRAATAEGIPVLAKGVEALVLPATVPSQRSSRRRSGLSREALEAIIYVSPVGRAGPLNWEDRATEATRGAIRGLVGAHRLEELLRRASWERGARLQERQAGGRFHLSQRALAALNERGPDPPSPSLRGCDLVALHVETWELCAWVADSEEAPTRRDLSERDSTRHTPLPATPDSLEDFSEGPTLREWVGAILDRCVAAWEHGGAHSERRCVALLHQFLVELRRLERDSAADPRYKPPRGISPLVAHLERLHVEARGDRD
jgi:hypothetical protein